MVARVQCVNHYYEFTDVTSLETYETYYAVYRSDGVVTRFPYRNCISITTIPGKSPDEVPF